MNNINRRRIEIVEETCEIVIIRTNSERRKTFCEICQATVQAFAPDQIAGFLHIELSDVCRLIESEKFHLTKQRRGFALVCANSLGSGGENDYLKLKRS